MMDFIMVFLRRLNLYGRFKRLCDMPAKQRGFTLIELIITVVIAALVLTLGIPSFQALIRNNRLVTQTNEFVTALNLARSEAINRGQRVTVCKSSDSASCSTASSWADGWIVFSDGSTVGSLDGTDELIRVWPGFEGDNTVGVGSNFDDYVSFIGDGSSRGNPGNNDTFRLCDPQTKDGREIIINSIGRARVSEYTCP